ncbi:MAG: signal peptide peptidase SppA [Candidatus Promineofilum sp.]|nr:signal peptide peptidase SppA [Promineifilum sp.]
MSDETDKEQKKSSALRLRRELAEIQNSVTYGWKAITIDIRNGLKRMRKARLDYVVLSVGGSLPERDGMPRGFLGRRLPFPAQPLSMQQLNDRLRAVIDADNVRGVVFVFTGFSARLATLQNFRAAVARLRAAGKEAIVYTPYLDLAHYYAATAAKYIVAPPSAQFEVLGLYTEVTFLKDAMTRAGLEVDVVQISPYKTALDRFSQTDITPENREQLDWLLDDEYDMLTTDMAAGRGISQTEMRKLIDQAPYPVEKARDLRLIDHVAYDDQLSGWLGRMLMPAKEERSAAKAAGEDDTKPNSQPQKHQAKLKTWKESRRILIQRPRRRMRKFVGVISLEGMIVTGTSRKPPIDLPIPFIGGEAAGDQTLVGLLRRAEKLEEMAALVFHIDSGGGSALASDLIARQIELLATKKPVVVYMGNIAASGGYYVSAPAQHIMSQQATLTGSIGVITGRLNSTGLYNQLSINRVTLKRGEHAGLYRDSEPWTETEREIFHQSIIDIYGQFRNIVARNRKLTPEEVDEIGLGRVWTGRQALTHRLVDSHGDFLDAIKKAAELAALPTDDIYAIPVANLFSRSSAYTLPVTNSAQVIEELTRLLAGEELKALGGQPLLLLPYDLRFR